MFQENKNITRTSISKNPSTFFFSCSLQFATYVLQVNHLVTSDFYLHYIAAHMKNAEIEIFSLTAKSLSPELRSIQFVLLL